MTSCVLDIETASLDPDRVPDALVRKLKDTVKEDEDWRDALGMYALGASVITIGLYSPESGKGVMLYDDRNGTVQDIAAPEVVNGVELHAGDERTLLEKFWQLIHHYRPVVTYNGRRFDIPFLMQRSLIHDVEITCNLMPNRYYGMTTHYDLADILTQYGATRPYGLEAWSQALGFASPKDGSVKGAEVGNAFRDGRIREIVEYCLRDVVATAEIAHRVTARWGESLGHPSIPKPGTATGDATTAATEDKSGTAEEPEAPQPPELFDD